MISELLLAAIALVETGGRDIVGDSGLAIGPLQIHPCVIQDVNRVYPRVHYTLEDRHDLIKSKEIARLYLDHYTPPGASIKEQAKCWNVGPRYKTRAIKQGEAYARKVVQHYNRLAATGGSHGRARKMRGRANSGRR